MKLDNALCKVMFTRIASNTDAVLTLLQINMELFRNKILVPICTPDSRTHAIVAADSDGFKQGGFCIKELLHPIPNAVDDGKLLK